MELSPSPHVSNLVLIGSHRDPDIVRLANRNLQVLLKLLYLQGFVWPSREAFARALPRPRSGPTSLIWPLPSSDVAEKEAGRRGSSMAWRTLFPRKHAKLVLLSSTVPAELQHQNLQGCLEHFQAAASLLGDISVQ